MTLFEQPATPRLGPMGHAEARVNWLLTSTRPEADRSRANVNAWYDAFPDPEGAFARRLQSTRNVDHAQALDELFVHHLLSRAGRTVTYEEDGAGPDFRVYEDGALLASVEVASLFEKAEWASEDLRHDRLVDDLNSRLDLSCGFFLNFEIDNEAGTGEPKPAKFATWIRHQMADLPDPRIPNRRTSSGFDGYLRVYTAGAVQVTVRFWPLNADAIPEFGSGDRVVSSGRLSGGWVTDGDRLRDRVTQKAGAKYDLRSSPFLVIVGVHAAFCDDGDFLNALYGGNAVRYTVGDSASVHPVRVNDGVFGQAGGGGSRWKNQRLSAVCRMSAPNTWDPDRVSASLFHNPSPAYVLPPLFDGAREFGVFESNETLRRLDWFDGLGLS